MVSIQVQDTNRVLIPQRTIFIIFLIFFYNEIIFYYFRIIILYCGLQKVISFGMAASPFDINFPGDLATLGN